MLIFLSQESNGSIVLRCGRACRKWANQADTHQSQSSRLLSEYFSRHLHRHCRSFLQLCTNELESFQVRPVASAIRAATESVSGPATHFATAQRADGGP